MCHADLESLRLEICLIESRVSKTRDSSTSNRILIESRVFETRDSIKQTDTTLLIQVTLTVAVHYFKSVSAQ